MSSRRENARGRSFSMKFSAPRNVSRPTLTKMPGGSLTLSRAAWTTPRGLTQLREHPARALGKRRVREHHLRRQAGAERVGVQLRIALPGPGLLELEHPRLDVRRDHRLLGLFDGRQIVDVDVLETAGKAGERTGVLLDRLAGSGPRYGRHRCESHPAWRWWDELRGDTRDSRRRSDGMARTNASCRLQLESLFLNVKYPTNHNGTILYPRMPGSLYVVSTPIGNLDDITLRALQHAESRRPDRGRRYTPHLPSCYATSASPPRPRAFTSTTSGRNCRSLLEKLAAGTDMALVSDAGTPMVADPGQRLTAAAHERGFRVDSDPGRQRRAVGLGSVRVPGRRVCVRGIRSI